MSQFVKKASSKISVLSEEEILRIIESQNAEIKFKTAILDNCELGYVYVHDNGLIGFLNHTAQTLLPLSKRKKFTGIHVSKVFLRSDILSYIQNSIEKKAYNCAATFQMSSSVNDEITVSAVSMKVKDYDGILFVFRDVTFLKKFKEQFRKNESLAAMTTMAAGVAHEIKNPLASMSIYVQLMEKQLEKNGSITKEEADKCLSVISEELDRINSIAVDFLFAVKPMNYKPQLINLNDIVEKTVNIAKPEISEIGVQLKVDLATSLSNVMADPALMEQSIINLLKNALQAMEGNENGVIHISTYMEGDMVKVSVQDNGCGMTEEQMSKIFEPYYTTKNTGTGLGLTVIFKIMKEHNGDIVVHSKKGEGSQFILQIPVPQSERFRISYNASAMTDEEVLL